MIEKAIHKEHAPDVELSLKLAWRDTEASDGHNKLEDDRYINIMYSDMEEAYLSGTDNFSAWLPEKKTLNAGAVGSSTSSLKSSKGKHDSFNSVQERYQARDNSSSPDGN